MVGWVKQANQPTSGKHEACYRADPTPWRSGIERSISNSVLKTCLNLAEKAGNCFIEKSMNQNRLIVFCLRFLNFLDKTGKLIKISYNNQ